MQQPEIRTQLTRQEIEIMESQCNHPMLMDCVDFDSLITKIIAQVCILTATPIPSDFELVSLERWIKTNYKTMTYAEIIIAFEKNIRGEYPETAQTFGQLTIPFFSNVINLYNAQKRFAWAKFNRLGKSEGEVPPDTSNRLESLKNYVKCENTLPETWDWSKTFDQMRIEKESEPDEILKKWMEPEKKIIQAGLNKLLHSCTNIFERHAIELQLTDSSINQELRKRYVRKRISELYLKK